MAHFAFIAPPLRGHYRPLSHLAAELIERGHEATFIHLQAAAKFVEADGARFAAIGHSPDVVGKWTRPMARIRGIRGLGGVLNGMGRFTDMFCREGPAILDRIGADALIVDQVEAGGGLLAEALGLPYASIAAGLPLNREEGIPPPYVGWAYQGGEKGRKRNRGGWRVTDFLMRGMGRAIERNCRLLNIPVRRRMEDCFSQELQIAQLVPGLDFPREKLPATFHYTGPLRRTVAESLELPTGDDRPLVYCTFGTLQGSRVDLFRKVAEACEKRNLRLLVTQGGMGNEKRAEGLSGDPLVYDWVPQQAVLQQADLVVCHGGMNTVLEPLAAGLPMVVMPLAFEQPAIAARLEYAGVAKVLSRKSSVSDLFEAIGEVRGVPNFRANARKVQAEIAAAGGVRRAADLIETTLI